MEFEGSLSCSQVTNINSDHIGKMISRLSHSMYVSPFYILSRHLLLRLPYGRLLQFVVQRREYVFNPSIAS